MAPDDELQIELDPDKRRTLRAALDQARGFLLAGGLDNDSQQVEAFRRSLNEGHEDDPVTVREMNAVRGVASLTVYREVLLDDGEVEAAAEVEETIRSLADQHDVLGDVVETGGSA